MDDDYAAFVRLRMPALLRFGHALTGNRHDALDLVQTALERTGVRWRTVRRSSSIRPRSIWAAMALRSAA